MVDVNVIWQPHPGPQTEFCSRSEFEALYGGQAGPGKTECGIMEALRDIDKPNYNGLILRRTFPQLQEIIDRTRIYYTMLGGEYRTGEHRWYFPSGARINLGHIQHEGDQYNYQGKEYQYVFFDEATQFTKDQYLYLFSRCRSSDPTITCRIRAATNPGGVGHQFIKDRFKIGLIPSGTTLWEDLGEHKISRVFIAAKITDNPTLTTNDPQYVARLMLLPELERLRLMEGIWDAFEGQAFPELNQEVHGIDPFDIPPEWTRYRTMDWGYATPFSVGWWAVDPNGVLFRYREWYGAKEGDAKNVGVRMTATEVARGIIERERPEREKGIPVRSGPADPDLWSPRWGNFGGKKIGVVGTCPAEDMQQEGVSFLQADNAREQGRLAVHRRLELDEKGDPQVYIFNTCLDFWRTMPQMKELETNPEDIESKRVEDHIYSEFRYMCMFRPAKPVDRPREDFGSFQAERMKLIKARKIAAAKGISVADAYRMRR